MPRSQMDRQTDYFTPVHARGGNYAEFVKYNNAMQCNIISHPFLNHLMSMSSHVDYVNPVMSSDYAVVESNTQCNF